MSYPTVQRNRLAALLMALGMLQPLTVSALGVGPAELRSHLGETLDVRLPIVLDGSEPAGELQARLLPFEAYAPLGLEAPRLDPGVLALELTENESGVWLALRSSRRVSEPLVVLLLETRLGSVRIVHELALMLEPSPPPAAMPESAAPVARLGIAAPRREDKPVPEPVGAAVSAGPIGSPAPALPTAPTRTPDARRYGPVEAAETLRGIAERVRPEPKYGIRRVMTALLLANPEGFDADRRPRADALLSVPSPRQMLDLSDETIAATVGPRPGAATALPPLTAAVPATAGADPAVPDLSPPEPAADTHAGLRLSLRLSLASPDAMAAAVDVPAEPMVEVSVPEPASAPEPVGSAASSPPSTQAATPVPDSQRAAADEPALEAASASAQIARTTRGPALWWLLALVVLTGAAWWWRRRGSMGQRPAMPTPPKVGSSQETGPAALSRERPVRMRVVGGRKDPAVVALQQRMTQLGVRPGVSQRTLTLASAYLDNGNVEMAGRLLDELEAPPRRAG